MDSQEKNLEQEAKVVEQQKEEAVQPTAEAAQTAAEAVVEDASKVEQPQTTEAPADKPTHPVFKDRKEVLERAKEIAHGDERPQKEEVELLKTVFYKMLIAERDADHKAYLDGGGDPEQYRVLPDEMEEAFKAEMSVIKEKRAKLFRELEAEKQENLKHKLAIIEKIKTMATTPEEANKNFQEFKALQQEWREIKAVPPERANELWRNYQLYVEQYYDLLKLNSEAREYDFKKNLERKTQLCEAAERLADEPDPVSAFHQLQKLHQEYRETGPVQKELREEIWARFKAASTVINKRHQQHFEGLRAKEEENLARKTALCEKVEAIAAEENKGSADWDRHSKEIIEVQNEWKTIGFAPQKMNDKIFKRFRAACDDFYGRKSEFFKGMKEGYKAAAEKKRSLIEQAKALQDSTEWKETGEKMRALQQEWKKAGFVPRKLGDQLWQEFLGACNKFFEARNAAGAGQHGEEKANLEKKRGIIAQLKDLLNDATDGAQEKLQTLVDEYNATGHVPFRDKEKLYKEYRATLDEIYEKLHISAAQRRLSKFKDSLKSVAERGADALDSERARLMRQYEAIKSEAQTYENNLGFLSVSSKKGNSLIEEMNRKLQKLKDDMNLVREKIKAIDRKDFGQPEPAASPAPAEQPAEAPAPEPEAPAAEPAPAPEAPAEEPAAEKTEE